MKAVDDLLAGSGVTKETHPTLVGLLEVAGRRPVPPLPDDPTVRQRFSRQWPGVAREFGKLAAWKVTDRHVREAMPFAGLVLGPSGWVCEAPALEVRLRVKDALERVSVHLVAIRGKSEPVKGRPCPFCGVSGKLLLTGKGDQMHAECRACGAVGPGAPTVEKALGAWNGLGVVKV